MTIRYLLTNAFGGGGTIRATINIANELARSHDVEIVSVLREVDEPKFAIHPSVRLRVLNDRYAAQASRPALRSKLSGAAGAWANRQPSRLIHGGDRRYDRFSLLTDVNLLRFLRSTRDGVLVSTRPGLNLAVARFVRPSVLRIAQEHINLAHHRRLRPELVEEIKASYNRFDAITTLTPTDAEDYRRLLGGETMVIAMPNAVPPAGVRADPASRVVVAAGRLTTPKGFDRLVRAFAGVVATHPDWQLRIFGEGDQRARLAKKIKRLELGDHVELRGFTTELSKEMAKASIYAMSSRFEGYPMVLLEAMACGLPIVSFDCPSGPRHIVDHDKTGLLITDGDVAALTAGLLDLIEHDERRAAMAAAAFEKSTRYTIEALAQRWVDLLSRLRDSHTPIPSASYDRGPAQAGHTGDRAPCDGVTGDVRHT